jgi:hypothetical protein
MYAPNDVHVFNDDGREVGVGHASDSHETEDVAVKIMRRLGLRRCSYYGDFKDGRKDIRFISEDQIASRISN